MPERRIIVIRKSLAAFYLGIVGLMPLIGILPGIGALSCWRRIRTSYGDEWNPASDYLDWGIRLALIGLAVSALLIGALVVAVWP